MATLSEHHQPKAGVIGKCSVALFDGYGSAGFCDRDAYGQQYTGSLSLFFGNNRAPLAMGLCCKIHGGAGEEDVRVMRDGNMWCAFRPDFENLQESLAGFGETQELALAALLQAEAAMSAPKAPSAVLQALLQYRDDLRFPPAADSVERRIAMVEALIKQVSA